MKAAAAFLVLLAVIAPAASAQPQCEQCAPLDASNAFVTWAGAFGRCTPATMQCSSNESVTFSVGTVNGYSCLSYERAWNFGDGTTSSEQAPAHVFGRAGTYNVSVTMTTRGGCNPPQSFGLTAGIAVSPSAWCDEGCPPVTPANSYITWSDLSRSPVTFTVGTQGANFACSVHTFQWDFGDGATSGQLTPTHTYAAPGTYAVSVTIGSIDGCTQQPQSFTLKQPVTLTAAPNRPQRRRSCCGH